MVRNKKEPKKEPVNEIDESVKSALKDAASFAPNAIKILMSIATADNPDENVTPSQQIAAVTALFDIIKKLTITENKEVLAVQTNEISEDLKRKIKEIKEVEEFFEYQNRLERLQNKLHLLPNTHPLYKSKESEEIKRYKRRWDIVFPSKPYPETEAGLREFYEDNLKNE